MLRAIAAPAPSTIDLRRHLALAAEAARQYLVEAIKAARILVENAGQIDAQRFEDNQHALHGLAWLATYVEAVGQMTAYVVRAAEFDRLGEIEALIARIGVGEFLAQITGGISMSQGETFRPTALNLTQAATRLSDNRSVAELVAEGNTPANRARLTSLMRQSPDSITHGDPGNDETLGAMRTEMRRFCQAEVNPHAHGWHLRNDYIPLEVIEKLAELGVFGLTVPEKFGGLGLGKEAMCVVSEELSRGYIGVGSLGTRSEIAAELILANGTPEQKARWLPRIASGEVLPTAVFTEPNTGSDLASLKTRAILDGDVWRVYGAKTWITHPVRADLMTMLVRTDPAAPGYKGLSILLGEKPRGTDADPFPVKGLAGAEIEVLGYRGMKEYELAFDGFEVKAANLLGGNAGQGFKQLMQTFEAARIQTGARAIGVAQAALDLGLRYAEERIQFGKPLAALPRVSDKLAMMAAEIMIARQLSYHAARRKDEGKRCDLEAGMAKLLGARVAWSAADNALQIHGGNGFALEYEISRVLCDARVLNIFEGAAEIQAQVIARRLLEGGN